MDAQRSQEDLLNLELRHVEASTLARLSAFLDRVKAWQTLLGHLTRPTSTQDEGRHSLPRISMSPDAVYLIERQQECGKSPAQAFLNHWSITGRRRPTVKTLIGYLQLCNLKWAESFVRRAILGVELIEAPQQAAIENTASSPGSPYQGIFIPDEFKFDNLSEIISNLQSQCRFYSFQTIYNSTNGFCHKRYDAINKTGAMVGEGRFSSVFRAIGQLEKQDGQVDAQIVAAKLLKSDCNKTSLANEIDLISKVKHENIIEFMGIALGQSHEDSLAYICLVYPFMENGSLLDCLSAGLASRSEQYLSWEKRIEIAVKIAKGISYLHNFPEGSIVHRDIKTANIFVNSDLSPKIGDFTLIRQLDSNTQFSRNIIGTSIYMPPEAFRGDISIKFDTFSFGIVIFELLTGMKPFDEESEKDLFTFISEWLTEIEDEFEASGEIADDQPDKLKEAKDKFLSEKLDTKAGSWCFDSAKVLFDTALLATESRKSDRPRVSDLVARLESVLTNLRPI